MEREKVEHATIVVERHFKASPEKVFAAYQDPEAHDRWNVPGDDWKLAEFHHDFRPGGETISRFGPEGDPHISARDITWTSFLIAASLVQARCLIATAQSPRP
jgi:uncharacterized protein YndB with AHSA1/START domain